MNAFTFADPLQAAQACARRVLEILESAGGRDASFAVSGGSTPRLMFEALAASGFDWTRVHLFWVDERIVPPGDDRSNYKLAFESFVRPAAMPESHVHRVLGELPPDEAAARYAADLRSFFGGNPPEFDAVHCGMGPDAHTASLFPGDPLIHDRDGWAAAVFAPKLPNRRVTLLPKVLLSAGHTLMLVTGGDKAETLRAVDREEYDLNLRPVQLLHREGRNVEWYLDSSAAARL